MSLTPLNSSPIEHAHMPLLGNNSQTVLLSVPAAQVVASTVASVEGETPKPSIHKEADVKELQEFFQAVQEWDQANNEGVGGFLGGIISATIGLIISIIMIASLSFPVGWVIIAAAFLIYGVASISIGLFTSAQSLEKMMQKIEGFKKDFEREVVNQYQLSRDLEKLSAGRLYIFESLNHLETRIEKLSKEDSMQDKASEYAQAQKKILQDYDKVARNLIHQCVKNCPKNQPDEEHDATFKEITKTASEFCSVIHERIAEIDKAIKADEKKIREKNVQKLIDST